MNLGPHASAASTLSTVPLPHPSPCVVLRAPRTIGTHTHELSMPVHGQRGRKRVSVGRGADAVKGEETSVGIETNKSLFASPSVKGHLVSPLHSPSSYFTHVFYMLCGLFLYPLCMAECQKRMCECYEMGG